eukprot:TRINITY_DN10965_c0_g1_i1.p2 TRINITY_DN10965_c0_g1~~TRINITY_DN10965_c0_g1_i1.p2  ORF type:complete len:202 (-),score=22.45 TRINITY_DN10965_c0_g1_i1:523-1044(-)
MRGRRVIECDWRAAADACHRDLRALPAVPSLPDTESPSPSAPLATNPIGRRWFTQLWDRSSTDSLAAEAERPVASSAPLPPCCPHRPLLPRTTSALNAADRRYVCIECHRGGCFHCAGPGMPEYGLADGSLAFVCDGCRSLKPLKSIIIPFLCKHRRRIWPHSQAAYMLVMHV